MWILNVDFVSALVHLCDILLCVATIYASTSVTEFPCRIRAVVNSWSDLKHNESTCVLVAGTPEGDAACMEIWVVQADVHVYDQAPPTLQNRLRRQRKRRTRREAHTIELEAS